MNANFRHSDEHLLTLIASDDNRAFKELFDRYWEKAYSIAFSKLKSREVAEEITLDVFVSFWQRRHDFSVEDFFSYLAVAVKYRVFTYIKRELAQQKHFETLTDLAPARETETITPLEYDDLIRAIEQGVQTLPEKTQHVFRLNRLEGRSVSEIADLLNLSEKAIQYHITRSVKELRVYLRDYLLFLILLTAWI